MARMLRYPMGILVKVDCVPSVVQANWGWEAVELGIVQNILAKFIAAKYRPVADWMESAILIIKLLGTEALMGWDHGFTVAAIHYGAPFFCSRFNRPNRAVKCRNSGNNNPSLSSSYKTSFNPGRSCFKLPWVMLTILTGGRGGGGHGFSFCQTNL